MHLIQDLKSKLLYCVKVAKKEMFEECKSEYHAIRTLYKPHSSRHIIKVYDFDIELSGRFKFVMDVHPMSL